MSSAECDIDAIAELAAGLLTDTARVGLERHLDACASCRALVAELHRDHNSPDAADLPVEIGTRIGRYTVSRWLGAGGMGVVYAAHDRELERTVALKLVPLGEREARALARISHPNVVAVYDVGRWGAHMFVAMEHVEGHTLRTWLAKPRSVAEILAVLEQAARGISAAHTAGVIHRDIKPSNILIGNDGRVRVTDFGLAVAPGSAGAETPQIAGTPAYMAPEQRRGGPVDERVDQYAFAVTAREALRGKRLSPRLRHALGRATAEKPDDRFATFQAFQQALAPHQSPWVWTAAVLFIGLGAALLLWRLAPQCDDGAAEMAAAWGDARRQAAQAAFESAKRPYALDTFHEVDRILRLYVTTWRDARLTACRARDRAAEHCLDERLGAVSALAARLVAADATVVDGAVRGALGLPAIKKCDAPPPLPADPEAQRRATEVVRLINEVNASETAGKYTEALAFAEQALAIARPGDGVRPRALLALGRMHQRVGHFAAAEDAMYDAAAAGDEEQSDEWKARALIQLVYVLGDQQTKIAEAARVEKLAEAALARARLPDSELRARFDDFIALARHAAGDERAALEYAERALRIREEAFGREHPNFGISLNNTVAVLRNLGRTEEAVTRVRLSLAIFARTLGAMHPTTVMVRRNLALELLGAKKANEALPVARAALADFETVLGPDHRNVSLALDTLSQALLELGETQEALTHIERALRINEQTLGPSNPSVADVLNVVGTVQLKLGQVREATATHERALSIWKAAGLEKRSGVADTWHDLGLDYAAAGRRREALKALENALRLREGKDGEEETQREIEKLRDAGKRRGG